MPEDIEAHWDAKQTKGPSRLWGNTKATIWGGEQRVDGEPEMWSKGEYWNVDSNIRIWGEHEVKRNAAAANHDVHRHDQITRIVLQPQPGYGKQVARQCMSGVVSPDSCFLEAWGFDLGLRDRQARPVGLWRPVNQAEQFRSERSYARNLPRMAENYRSLRKSASLPRMTITTATLRPEDIGGEAGDAASPEDNQIERMGRTYGSRSCHYWDQWSHTSKREAAKLSNSVHSPALKLSPEGHPFKENVDLAPAAVYTLKYRKFGENSLRRHVTSSEKAGVATARSSATRSGVIAAF